jgi:hypothetical protein
MSWWNSINISGDVSINVYDILEKIHIDYIKEELKERDYSIYKNNILQEDKKLSRLSEIELSNIDVSADSDDVLDELNLDDMISKIEDHGYIVKDECEIEEIENPFYYEENDNLYRYLCDIAGTNYHIDKEELLKIIKNKI